MSRHKLPRLVSLKRIVIDELPQYNESNVLVCLKYGASSSIPVLSHSYNDGGDVYHIVSGHQVVSDYIEAFHRDAKRCEAMPAFVFYDNALHGDNDYIEGEDADEFLVRHTSIVEARKTQQPASSDIVSTQKPITPMRPKFMKKTQPKTIATLDTNAVVSQLTAMNSIDEARLLLSEMKMHELLDIVNAWGKSFPDKVTTREQRIEYLAESMTFTTRAKATRNKPLVSIKKQDDATNATTKRWIDNCIQIIETRIHNSEDFIRWVDSDFEYQNKEVKQAVLSHYNIDSILELTSRWEAVSVDNNNEPVIESDSEVVDNVHIEFNPDELTPIDPNSPEYLRQQIAQRFSELRTLLQSAPHNASADWDAMLSDIAQDVDNRFN